MKLPERLETNAWAGGRTGISGPVSPDVATWATVGTIPAETAWFLAGPPVDPRNWSDEQVGWGVILRHVAGLTDVQLATAADAPQPIQELIAVRGNAPVLRYRGTAPTSLFRYDGGAESSPLDIGATEFGRGQDRIPRYLLIYGSPSVIPWSLQFALNARFAVGRISLEDEPLRRYVRALIDGWPADGAKPLQPVVWATQLNSGDVSAKMRQKVALPVFRALRADTDIGAAVRMLDADHDGATAATLRSALAERTPGLIVTTSHGKAGTADGNATTLADLGFLVGEDESLVSPDDLFGEWEPAGAIWYAHACCSAGSSSLSVYEGLFKLGTANHDLLQSVSALGDAVAPLPEALLGHERPLRAFVGHVEPTFSWTIENQRGGLTLASGLRSALYDCLYQPDPVPIGLAMYSYFSSIGAFASQLPALTAGVAAGTVDTADLLSVQLGARDRMSTVLLGDPTVTLDLTAVTGAGGTAGGALSSCVGL